MLRTLHYEGYLGTFIICGTKQGDTKKIDVEYVRDCTIRNYEVCTEDAILRYDITEPAIVNFYNDRVVRTKTHFIKRKLDNRSTSKIKEDIQQGLQLEGYRFSLRDSIYMMSVYTAEEKFMNQLLLFIDKEQD